MSWSRSRRRRPGRVICRRALYRFAVRPDVFISYSSSDREYVDRLATHLQSCNLDVWYDYELAAGDQFDSVIQQKIDASAAVVVVLTPLAVASAWVRREILYAEQRNKDVLPVLLEPCELPLIMVQLHHENLIGGRMPSEAFITRLRHLVNAMATDAAARLPTQHPQWTHRQRTAFENLWRAFSLVDDFNRHGIAQKIQSGVVDPSTWTVMFDAHAAVRTERLDLPDRIYRMADQAMQDLEENINNLLAELRRILAAHDMGADLNAPEHLDRVNQHRNRIASVFAAAMEAMRREYTNLGGGTAGRLVGTAD